MPFVLAVHRAQRVRHIQHAQHAQHAARSPRFTGYYSSKSNRLFMSVSFMGEPEEGRLAARNFSTLAVPPRNSSAVPTMVTDAAVLRGERQNALRTVGGLGL